MIVFAACGIAFYLVGGMAGVILVMLAGWEPQLSLENDCMCILGIFVAWPAVVPVVVAVLIGRLLKKPRKPRLKDHFDF